MSFRRGMTGVTRSVRGFQGQLAGLLGVAGLGAFIHKTIAGGREIRNFRDRLNIGSRALSEYKFLADATGVSFQTMTMGLQRMTRRVAEAARGTGEARGALRELRIDARSFNNLAPDQQFERIADALMNIRNPADRVRLAMKLFDSEGVALLQTMRGGSKVIGKFREEARQLGLSLSDEQVDQLVKADLAMKRLKGTVEGFGTQVLVTFGDDMVRGIETLKTAFIPTIEFVGKVLGRLGRFIGGISAAFSELFSGNFRRAGSIAMMSLEDLFQRKSTGAVGARARSSPITSGSQISGGFDIVGNQFRTSAPVVKDIQRQTQALEDIKDLLQTRTFVSVAS